MRGSLFSRLTYTDTGIIMNKSLDAMAARQKTIANNIANVETPGYKRSYVNFERELARIMDKDPNWNRTESLEELNPVRSTDIFSPTNQKGNNVNIDAEIADLAKTTLNFKALATIRKIRGSIVQSAILGR